MSEIMDVVSFSFTLPDLRSYSSVLKVCTCWPFCWRNQITSNKTANTLTEMSGWALGIGRYLYHLMHMCESASILLYALVYRKWQRKNNETENFGTLKANRNFSQIFFKHLSSGCSVLHRLRSTVANIFIAPTTWKTSFSFMTLHQVN